VQVKSGEMSFDFDALPDDQGDRWAYVASGRVSGEGTQITTGQLVAFMTDARDWLPGKLRRWIAQQT
jgi:hypothetical protein